MANLFEETRGSHHRPKTCFAPSEVKHDALERFSRQIDEQLRQFDEAMKEENKGFDRRLPR